MSAQPGQHLSPLFGELSTLAAGKTTTQQTSKALSRLTCNGFQSRTTMHFRVVAPLLRI
jgi:hypothetical protein